MKNINILPNHLHSIFIGLMLGDGHINKSSPTSNSRFEMSFGKDRELFANWVGNLFKDYSNIPANAAEGATAPGDAATVHNESMTGSQVIKKVLVKNKNTNYYNFRFKTKSLPIFNYYHDIFYVTNNVTPGVWKCKKIIPHNIFDFMDPAVLAYLIMTDGNFDKLRNRVRIYTNGYSKVEVERLAEAIHLKLNIYVGVLLDRKDQWILTIGAKQLKLLREIVMPHFDPSMLYRIGWIHKQPVNYSFYFILYPYPCWIHKQPPCGRGPARDATLLILKIHTV
jgi:hypothetical protein